MLRWLWFDLAYLFRPRWDRGISPPELLAYIASHPPGRALDLGCGSGTNVVTLAQYGWQVTGIDFSPRAIRMARGKLLAAGLAATLLVGDVTASTRVDGQFDLALDVGCFHTIQDRPAYLDNLAVVVPGGGHWLMYGFVPPRGSRAGMGVHTADIELAASRGFHLKQRSDGMDRPGRASAWFLFERLPLRG